MVAGPPPRPAVYASNIRGATVDVHALGSRAQILRVVVHGRCGAQGGGHGRTADLEIVKRNVPIRRRVLAVTVRGHALDEGITPVSFVVRFRATVGASALKGTLSADQTFRPASGPPYGCPLPRESFSIKRRR